MYLTGSSLICASGDKQLANTSQSSFRMGFQPHMNLDCCQRFFKADYTIIPYRYLIQLPSMYYQSILASTGGKLQKSRFLTESLHIGLIPVQVLKK